MFCSRTKGFLSFDVDVSGLEVDQCSTGTNSVHGSRQIHAFKGSHKCHNTTQVLAFAFFIILLKF